MPHATILYAEDNQLLRLMITEMLEDEGYSVETCSDGNIALNRIAGCVGYELLLLDNDLPGACGIELARYARRLSCYKRTPIILLSADGDAGEARRAGADAFLRKPEDVSRLVETIRALLDARRGV
jgi:CheY-like chemotaxis protein